MLLKSDEIHIWSVNLAISDEDADLQATTLSPDENARAERFHFPIHRKRFIAAHSALRKILSQYLHYPAEKMVFAYNEHDKPYLFFPTHLNLHFNLSHSQELALVALRLDYVVGIDVEQYKIDFTKDLVARYFSQAENAAFNRLAAADQAQGFYHFWTKKEAFIKAVGKGLTIPLTSFSVSFTEKMEEILFENKIWYLKTLTNYADYAAAIASDYPFALHFYHYS